MKKTVVILASILLAQNAMASKVINKDVTFTEKTYGVCSTEMTVSVKDGKIESFSAVKGCPGNLAAIGKLLPGMEVTKVIELLDDNYCSGAPLAGYTSCMDNLVEMLKKHVTGEGEGPMIEIRKAQRAAKLKVAFSGHVCSGCGLCQASFS
ncbi:MULTISPECIES: TSCPD domain-containing protein [unclassified Fusobacterium]|uniref:TSCPD domain-containing protein n=1 Tax=unclassified Fusobacterium TaxID=2648384 RepID=UPI0025C573E5|nr:TSCPD domain-containing protein [Fusobacterium sp.]